MLAYFDCFSGASGDMIVGALLDAGLPLDSLRVLLDRLPLHGYTLQAAAVRKGALGGTQFTVTVDPAREQPHRHLADILALIDAADLPESVAARAAAIFRRLAQAEARVHRVDPAEVHFHEVGAVDSIVDVVGAVAGLHLLGVETVYSSALPAATGGREIAHGWIPLPGPATLEILAAAGAPLVPAEGGAELVTPTGAAILAELATFRQPAISLRRVGYGAGQADLARPNLLRVMLGEALAMAAATGEAAAPGHADELLLLMETNLDDMSPQIAGYLVEELLAGGALDVYCTPILMKKSRPATMLSVLCRPAEGDRLREQVLRETTTLGVRVQPIWRHAAARTFRHVRTPWGPVRAKVKVLAGRAVAAVPEYEDCAALARTANLPLQQVMRAAQAAADRLVDET